MTGSANDVITAEIISNLCYIWEPCWNATITSLMTLCVWIMRTSFGLPGTFHAPCIGNPRSTHHDVSDVAWLIQALSVWNPEMVLHVPQVGTTTFHCVRIRDPNNINNLHDSCGVESTKSMNATILLVFGPRNLTYHGMQHCKYM
jgi:hypothetical protein